MRDFFNYFFKFCEPQCVCLKLCVSLASDSLETVDIIVKLGTVTASDMGMHHNGMLFILTLAFIQGHPYLNNETDQCFNKTFIISKTIQALYAHQVCCEDSLTKAVKV